MGEVAADEGHAVCDPYVRREQTVDEATRYQEARNRQALEAISSVESYEQIPSTPHQRTARHGPSANVSKHHGGVPHVPQIGLIRQQ